MTYERRRRPADGAIVATRIELINNDLEDGEGKLSKSLKISTKTAQGFKAGELKIDKVGKFKLLPDPEVHEYVSALGGSLIPEYQRDLALFRPAFRLGGSFTLGATFQRQAASGPTAPYGLIAGGDQGFAFVVRPDGAYAVQRLTGGTIAGASWVARARAADPAPLERLEVRVEGETAEFVVNGSVVTLVPIAPGALDGAAGVYVGELGDVAVLGFSVRTSELVLPSPAVR